MIGNLAGDFVKVADMRFMKPEIERGVLLHRKIDKFTDSHKVVDKSIARLAPDHGRYAAVIVDILYDHLLSTNWNLYSDESLDDFKKRNYEILTRRHDDLPDRLRKNVPKMVDKDFIEGYRSMEGMRLIMSYMDKRTSFPSKFEESINQFEEELYDFTEDFNLFFPQLVEFVNTEIGV